jgi:hypothetical protein
VFKRERQETVKGSGIFIDTLVPMSKEEQQEYWRLAPGHIEFSDEHVADDDNGYGAYRSWHLSVSGHAGKHCLVSLLEEAQVTLLDQDGGEIRTESIYDAKAFVTDICERLIAEAWVKGQAEYKAWRKGSL